MDFPFHQSFWSEARSVSSRTERSTRPPCATDVGRKTLLKGWEPVEIYVENTERETNWGVIYSDSMPFQSDGKKSDHPGLIPDFKQKPQTSAIPSLGLELRPVVAGIRRFLGFLWRQGWESSELGFIRGVYCLVMVMDADFWWFQVSHVLNVLTWPTRKCSRHCFRFARRVAQVGSSSLFWGDEQKNSGS